MTFTPHPGQPRLLVTAWLVLALLWPVALLNYLDRQMLAAMKFSVMTDIPSIGLEANWGLLLGSFKWVYALLSPFGGYLADRFSRRHVIAASLFVWSAVTWLTGHATTFHELAATRALMGISEACYIPAALALIADFHRGPTRSRAIGLHQTAIYCGIIFGGFTGYISDSPALGWRVAFSTAGVIGLIYAVPLFLFLRNAPSLSGDPALPKPGAPSALRELLGNRSFLLLILYFTLPALAGWVVKDWMPAILKQQFHLGQGRAGVSATLYVNVAALLGAALGGWLADRWMRRSLRGRIFISAIGMSLFIPSLFGVSSARTLAAAIVFLALFGIGWGFFDANNMPILCQIVRPRLRATGYGIMNLVSTSCGGFADWGFGALRDRHVALPLIFGVFASAAAVSIVIALLIRPQGADAGGEGEMDSVGLPKDVSS